GPGFQRGWNPARLRHLGAVTGTVLQRPLEEGAGGCPARIAETRLLVHRHDAPARDSGCRHRHVEPRAVLQHERWRSAHAVALSPESRFLLDRLTHCVIGERARHMVDISANVAHEVEQYVRLANVAALREERAPHAKVE